MKTAQRLYERLGFVRDPLHDWSPAPGIQLCAYVLDLGAPERRSESSVKRWRDRLGRPLGLGPFAGSMTLLARLRARFRRSLRPCQFRRGPFAP
jgi:hypothetical protein